MKTRLVTVGVIATTIALIATGCASASAPASTTAATSVTAVKVGATFPADEVLRYVESSGQAKKAGIEIQVTSFTDYTTPNTALEDSSMDANLYQHLPFLTNFNKANGTDIVPVGKVYFPALALYSSKITKVSQIKNGDTIPIPSDLPNELRSLNLLQKAGLITVKTGATGVIGDVATNPKNLKFQELDAATLPRAIDENVAGIVNLTYALPAGLPAGLTGSEQIYKESVTGTKYTNLLATKKGRVDDRGIQALYKALTSAYINKQYKGLITAASGPAE